MTPRPFAHAALAAALLVGLAGPSNAAEQGATNYLAIIDAGSSGTRLTLYADDPRSLLPRETASAKTNTRGLSSFAAEPAQAGPGAVTPLLEQLDTYLTQNGIAAADVPVALLATAGMRNVLRDNPPAAQAILSSTAAALTASGHPVADNRILPAAQEATLAWLDANVLAGTLTKKVGGIGIVEIGGASAQVAFRSPVPTGPAVRSVRVGGQVIPVVAVSYLGLGGNDARTRMQADNDAGSFCFPGNAPGANPITYVPTSSRPVTAGTARFSWDRCTKAYQRTITAVGGTRNEAAPRPPAALKDLRGFDAANFVGLGSLPFTYSDLRIMPEANERTALRSTTTTDCTGTDAWATVLALFAGRSSTFADTLCSTAAYSYALLFGPTGVGVKPTRFTVDPKAFPRLPAWTSGYATTVLDQ